MPSQCTVNFNFPPHCTLTIGYSQPLPSLHTQRSVDTSILYDWPQKQSPHLARRPGGTYTPPPLTGFEPNALTLISSLSPSTPEEEVGVAETARTAGDDPPSADLTGVPSTDLTGVEPPDSPPDGSPFGLGVPPRPTLEAPPSAPRIRRLATLLEVAGRSGRSMLDIGMALEAALACGQTQVMSVQVWRGGERGRPRREIWRGEGGRHPKEMRGAWRS